MKKKYMLPLIATIGIATVMRRKNAKNRTKIKENIKYAGRPGQLEDKGQREENANMVAEGSQYGVRYYNEWKEKNRLKE